VPKPIIEVGHTNAQRGSGVIDDAIDLPVVLDRLRYQVAHLRGITHIAGNGDRIGPGGSDLRRHVLARLEFAAGDDDLRAGRGEPACDGSTKAARTPGDDGNSSGEIEQRDRVDGGDGGRV